MKPRDYAALMPHLSPTLRDGRYLHWDDLRRRPPRVTYLTARKDLLGLTEVGLLTRVRVGKTDRYLPSEAMQQRVRKRAQITQWRKA